MYVGYIFLCSAIFFNFSDVRYRINSNVCYIYQSDITLLLTPWHILPISFFVSEFFSIYWLFLNILSRHVANGLVMYAFFKVIDYYIKRELGCIRIDFCYMIFKYLSIIFKRSFHTTIEMGTTKKLVENHFSKMCS